MEAFKGVVGDVEGVAVLASGKEGQQSSNLDDDDATKPFAQAAIKAATRAFILKFVIFYISFLIDADDFQEI